MKQETLPQLLMGLLALTCLILICIGLYKALQRTDWPQQHRRQTLVVTVIILVCWVALVGKLAYAGLLSDFSAFPPRPLLLVFLPIAVGVAMAFTKPFVLFLRVVPPHWLVLFQSFRIVVELLLWQAFVRGLLPVQMTFEGHNYDIVAGVLALVVGWLMAKRVNYAKKIGIAYNIIGLCLLLNIMVISILSMPTPMQVFTATPSNTIVTTFPFVYLPTVLVVTAFLLHVFSLRQLLLKDINTARLNENLQHNSVITA